MKTTTRILQLVAIATALFFFSASGTAESSSQADVKWMTDFEAAKEKAASENKPMLVNFTGSDWCGYCIALERSVFTKEAFKKFAKENLVLVELDFPMRKEQSAEVKAQNEALAKKYGVEGFPTILIMDSDGEVLKQTGFRRGGAEAYVQHIKSLLPKES